MSLRALRARPVLVPIRRPPVSASGAIPEAALVLFDLETDEGVTGRSYVFGFAPWTLSSIAACAQGLFAMIEGGVARIPDRPGAGIRWDEAAVARYAV
jgi:mandelate racemase